MSVTALIVAAGSGTRMGDGVPKQYRLLGGQPVLRRAVEALARHPRVDAVRVVIAAAHEAHASQALHGLEVGRLVLGGQHRMDSVRAGLAEAHGGQVLVHDAARPFCPPQVVDRLLDALGTHDGCAPVLEVGDTLARAGELLGDPIDRAGAVRVQTPQAFDAAALRLAYDQWHGEMATDETSVARAAGLTVAVVAGDPLLDKLTTPADWDRAEAMLAARLVSRTGLGFDVHGFGGDGPVMLGGIAVPHSRGLAGHSDADVVLHSITDALLGAAGLGDIGQHFPPSDTQWRNAASDRFLAHAAGLIRSAGGVIDHVDCTIICEEPKVGPHRTAMRVRIANILGLSESDVSIKATTTEGLGFTGRREGIAAQAVASIRLEARR